MGLIQDEEQFVESIPFNDLERSLKILNTIRDDLACIIVEPVLGGAGCITPERDYLHGLQEFAKSNDALFILDEIVTGFRLSFRGAADEYKLEPDLFTLGKIVGGGLPIGVLCGDKDIMSLCNPVGREKSEVVCYIGGGTFAANPLTMTAGLATLQYLKQNKSVIYPKINKIGQRIREGLKRVFSRRKDRCGYNRGRFLIYDSFSQQEHTKNNLCVRRWIIGQRFAEKISFRPHCKTQHVLPSRKNGCDFLYSHAEGCGAFDRCDTTNCSIPSSFTGASEMIVQKKYIKSYKFIYKLIE